MLKKTITYVDYNDVEHTEDFYFNLSKAELVEMQWSVAGGLSRVLEKIVEETDMVQMSKLFKDIILKSYGEKSADGKRFVKSAEMSEAFEQSEAYSVLLMELLTDEQAAADFVNGLLPKDLAAAAASKANQDATQQVLKPAN
jgi:hypothetical protein